MLVLTTVLVVDRIVVVIVFTKGTVEAGVLACAMANPAHAAKARRVRIFGRQNVWTKSQDAPIFM